MLDINRILQNPEVLLDTLQKRGFDSKDIESKISEVSSRQRKLKLESEELRAERNKVSKEIGILKAKGEDISSISQSMKSVGDRIKAIEDELASYEESLHDINIGLPNLLDDSVPFGKDEKDNVLVKTFGEKNSFTFPVKPHFEIGEAMGIFDFERGVKLSGARFYTYSGLAAKLERALMNLMLDTHTTENGYREMWVPVLVNDESMTATGQLPKFAEDFYRLEKDGLNLIPTAEVPLTNYYRDEIIADKDLPISMCAHTSCFRREAGSYGKDTRGLVRVHQFQKVELVKFCRPEDSQTEHEKMLSDAESILQKLNLHYRVMLLCSQDMSAASSKTYDIEVWMPGLGRYMEISSVSNFKDYQARRGKIRYKSKEGKNLLIHTLNGSGLAIGRTLAAVIENYQTEDGTFAIPDVLKSYIR
ncbi:seryl-tRNA synthetase [Leptospira ryugenii]|uniref:Serine--tRNA ligase n=1 Tax=Leptospira ryugenii TaxID=1917863 RepID=A0A2P2E394_9LEPT|nr:serine--tRNA ligase [Leptospira ryugenii]GBF51347.1 seryl-tRNA synthetase [Leptospira ryugenii]